MRGLLLLAASPLAAALAASPRRLSTSVVPRARAVMTGADLIFGPLDKAAVARTVLVGRKTNLLSSAAIQALAPSGCPADLWTALVESAGDAGDDGKSVSTLYVPAGGGAAVTICAAVLPEACSRYASPVRPHAVTALVGGAVGGAASALVVAVLDDLAHAPGTAAAIGRAFPLFEKKMQTGPPKPAASVRVSFASASGGANSNSVAYATCEALAMGVRRACRLVDMPPADLTTTQLTEEARLAAARLEAAGKAVAVEVIKGDALLASGHGLIHAVGRCAVEPPALVVLSYVPKGAVRTVALVGKGIVYDTGGLALKSKEGMCGMKADMGGAAALLGAFEAAVAVGTGSTAVHLVLCVAENAIGPDAVRNDDVVSGVSGKTVEINNSDAEGRLVLADGVAHATALPSRLPGLTGQPDLVIDMATLTGAQMVATGKRIAAAICNSEEVEAAAVAAGRLTGDLVCPLPYAPEFYRKEFKSQIADMKNSVKDRGNAQASCAANFIAEHLHPDFNGGWLHIDLAGPAFIEDRGTGFGVGLAVAMIGVEGVGAAAAAERGKKRARK